MCQPVQSCPTPFRVISSEEEGAVRSLSPMSDGEGQVNEHAGAIQPLDNHHMSNVRFPCRARGVTDTHNARSAFIAIPSTVAHGTDLICSHPICAASGRRFKYCATCKIPVAKRNFSKRHAHGLPEDFVLPDEEPVRIKVEDDASSTHSIGKRQRLNSNGDARRFDDVTHPPVYKKESFEEVPCTVVVGPAPSVSNSEASLTSTELTAKERLWLDLYRSRPLSIENEQDFREWMEAIIEAADFREEQEDAVDVEDYLSLLLDDFEVNQGEE
jgi:hypothetical protein